MHADKITVDQIRVLGEWMSILHPGPFVWDVAGCRAAILKAASKAPADELGIAASRFATRSDLRSPAVFPDDGPHWRGLEEAMRRTRPADLPRCPIHAPETLPCRWCEAERKAEANPAAPVVMVTDEQRAINVAGLARAQAALAEARRS